MIVSRFQKLFAHLKDFDNIWKFVLPCFQWIRYVLSVFLLQDRPGFVGEGFAGPVLSSDLHGWNK
jgi:hypothetical protein